MQPPGNLGGVFQAFWRRERRGHRYGPDGLGAERIGGESRHHRRVDPSRETDNHVSEAILADIVPEPEDQRAVDLLGALRPGRTGWIGERPGGGGGRHRM